MTPRINPSEPWMTPESRWIEMPDGAHREVTMPYLYWEAYDNLVIDSWHSHELLVTYAEKPGWDPPDAPFEDRFSSIIADTHNRWRARRREGF